MQLQTLIEYLIKQQGVEECYPFDNTTRVYKIMDKMFALIGHREGQDFINLKADPVDVLFLTQQFQAITPGYHMNKKHWITVQIADEEAGEILQRLVDSSYQLVRDKLTKKQQIQLEAK